MLNTGQIIKKNHIQLYLKYLSGNGEWKLKIFVSNCWKINDKFCIVCVGKRTVLKLKKKISDDYCDYFVELDSQVFGSEENHACNVMGKQIVTCDINA